MEGRPYKVLLIEDNPGDARLIERMLAESGGRKLELETTARLAPGIERVARGGVDVILLDLSLPDSSGLDTFFTMRESAPSVPIVVMSGLADQETAVRAVHEGAQDYLVKGTVEAELLVRALVYAIERKRAEAELRAAKEAAETGNRTKSQFVAVVSHEIRAPLSAIIGFAELLRETPLSPDQRSYSDLIVQSGRSLLDLSNDLLELFTLEVRRPELQSVDLDLGTLIDGIVRANRSRAEAKGLELVAAIDPDVPLERTGDPGRVAQIIANLVGNAIKFTEKGSVRVEVRRGPSAEPTNLVISVADTGIGIPADKQQLIFESFTQADASIRERFGGSGIGLAVCRRLVDLLGGRIWVESEPGKGSTFHFQLDLPLRVPLRAEPPPVEPPAAEPPPAGPSVEAESSRRLRVLVVEDSEDLQMLVRTFLKGSPMGIDVDVASNGQIGVDKFTSGHYDLVFMDMQMPIMDGHSATAAIRRWEREQGKPPTPIVALTAHAMAEEVQKSLDSGCNAHLTKPITKRQLLSAVREYVVS